MSSIRLGLAEIAITDHVDYGIKYDWSEIDQMPYRQNEADFPSALISIVLRYQVSEIFLFQHFFTNSCSLGYRNLMFVCFFTCLHEIRMV